MRTSCYRSTNSKVNDAMAPKSYIVKTRHSSNAPLQTETHSEVDLEKGAPFEPVFIPTKRPPPKKHKTADQNSKDPTPFNVDGRSRIQAPEKG